MLRAWIGSFLALAGAACGLTWLYLGMRSVMEIGGACAEGGPYEIATPCPEGVPLLIVGGIFLALISVAVFVAFASRLGGQYAVIGAYAWPALFISLGWNFLEYGLNPPGPDDGLVWGWLFCAVLFFAMGGLPLLALIKPSTLRKTWWPPDPDPFAPAKSSAPIGAALGSELRLGDRPSAPPTLPGVPSDGGPPLGGAPPGEPPPSVSPSGSAPPGAVPLADGDVVARLERLAALRDRGAIDAEEYERAKKAVLDG